MLKHLKIHNYALIRQLDIDLGDGLNTITGETGTGKSIMLGALGLILGNRADSSVLFDKERKCVVEGRFNIAEYDLKAFFDGNDLDWEESTLLRREINASGKSRAFINDTPVTLPVLKELGEQLVDIHSQHQTMKLLSKQFQLLLLDAVAGQKSNAAQYSSLYGDWRKKVKALAELKDILSRNKKERDFNLFQLNEILELQLKPAELKEVEEELAVLSHAEDIKHKLGQAAYNLEGDENAVNMRLADIRKQLASLATYNTELNSFHQRIESALLEMQDLYNELENFQEKVHIDNARMEELNNRLQLINNLLHKHQLQDTDELTALARELEKQVNAADDMDDQRARLQKQVDDGLHTLQILADTLTEKRREQIPALEDKLSHFLKQLGIPEAVIKIRLDKTAELAENGQDVLEILFSANKGTAPAPVAQAASGGELSRIMLCLKYILAESIQLPTLIFDEIDTGISGEVAIKVGQMIRQMSARHQVITITHQPQVAAMGKYHYTVYKEAGEDTTTTNIRMLSPEERIVEIAKMIAGHKPSNIAVENAKELLAGNY